MHHQQIQERCLGSKFIKRVFLKGYKFVYDGYSKKRAGSVANIVKSEGDTVCGGLFEIKKEHLKSLDGYEGEPYSYSRKEFNIEDEDSNNITAIVYFREGRELGTPSELYRKIVIQGARDCGLSDKYIADNL